MTIQLYLFRGKILIPTLGLTEVDALLSIEPVETMSAVDPEALGESLKRVLARGNPSTPHPSGPKAFPKDPTLKHAGVGWRAFEQEAQIWMIDVTEQNFEIIPMRRREDRGFEEDSARKEVLPRKIGVEGLARRMAEIIKQKRAEES